MNPKFAQYQNDDVRRLIADYPLAWVLAPGAPLETATMLPMLGEYDDDGRLVRLIGHMSRRRGLQGIFERTPTGHFLFTGPQGYISAEDSGRRSWGPTWNYAAVRVEAEVTFTPDRTGEAVARLAQACEAGHPQPWQPEELGARYDGMLAAIIAFEARVTAIDATFKLAQDEDDEVLGRLVGHHPDPAMREWIRALNPGRLHPEELD